MSERCSECGALEPYWNASEADPGLGKLAAEIERLRELFKELRAAWFKGGDLDKDHVSQVALRIFIEAEHNNQQLEEKK